MRYNPFARSSVPCRAKVYVEQRLVRDALQELVSGSELWFSPLLYDGVVCVVCVCSVSQCRACRA